MIINVLIRYIPARGFKLIKYFWACAFWKKGHAVKLAMVWILYEQKFAQFFESEMQCLLFGYRCLQSIIYNFKFDKLHAFNSINKVKFV